MLTHLESERTLSFLLGLRATLLQKATSLQPAEIQCRNLLRSPVFSGGLQVLQPSNPFDEEKGEARSSTSTAGSTPTEASGHVNLADMAQPIHWPHTVSARVRLCLRNSIYIFLHLRLAVADNAPGRFAVEWFGRRTSHGSASRHLDHDCRTFLQRE